jgi:hypothetical protein
MSTFDALAIVRASGRTVHVLPNGVYYVYNCHPRYLTAYELRVLARGIQEAVNG